MTTMGVHAGVQTLPLAQQYLSLHPFLIEALIPLVIWAGLTTTPIRGYTGEGPRTIIVPILLPLWDGLLIVGSVTSAP